MRSSLRLFPKSRFISPTQSITRNAINVRQYTTSSANTANRVVPQNSYFSKTLLFAGAVGLSGLAYWWHETFYAEEKSQQYVYKIVLTGGPCGGKSTALSQLSTRLKSLGYDVYLVPEVATMIITAGTSFAGRTREEWIALQIQLMGIQRKLEDAFEAIAKLSGKPAVLLCDRGLCDNRAYLAKEDFDLLLDLEGVKLSDIRDKRYDAVFHLVTAAIGAEQFYTTANNTARSETVEEARALDYRVLDAWVGHPNLRVIDNSTTFDGKIKRVVDGICKAIGATPSYPERRFLLDPKSIENIPPELTVEKFNVEMMIFTEDNGSQTRVIRRTQKGNSTYLHTTSQVAAEDGQRVIESRQISGREYMNYIKNPNKRVVLKKLSYFLWNGKYYAVNEYLEPDKFIALEVESPANVDGSSLIPPFLTATEEITNIGTLTSAGIVAKH